MQVIQVGCSWKKPSGHHSVRGLLCSCLADTAMENPEQIQMLHHLILAFNKMPLTSTPDEDDTSARNLL